VPKHLKDHSLEYKFLEKHKELLAEPVKLAGKETDTAEDTKTDTAEENNNEPENGASQSNSSLLKSQRKKYRLMSLMELLSKYMNPEANKNKKFDCENCKPEGM